MEILFVAAENGALPGGQVGGVGDVVRDLPPALAARGCRVTVLTPSHGFLHRQAGARRLGGCRFRFRGQTQEAEILEVAPAGAPPGVAHRVLHHPGLAARDAASGAFRIYAHDPAERPFHTDASRFALFGAAAAAAVAEGALGPFQVLHLHDWHAAPVALLGRFDPPAAPLRALRWVFSIHNLAYQGVRPLAGSDSSLAAWYPDLRWDYGAVADPRWPDCLNLMAVGIRLAQRVHTVSPGYAEEIRQAARPPDFHGGEGLEADLQAAQREGRLAGILNGCAYPPGRRAEPLAFEALLDRIRREVIGWSGAAEGVPAAHFVAFARSLEMAAAPPPDMLLTSVGRVVAQKLRLLRETGPDGRTGLEGLLEALGGRGAAILLGTGDREYERFLTRVSARHPNFLFANGYSEACAQALYASGDLFLMPSSFEPCGLGQLLAMRDGQPCLVHAVGGLKDTVRHGHNGFVFSGGTIPAQVAALRDAAREAVALKRRNPEAWAALRANAAAARFTWEEAAGRYLEALYA